MDTPPTPYIPMDGEPEDFSPPPALNPSKVQVPAIIMLIWGGLFLLLAIFSLVFNSFMPSDASTMESFFEGFSSESGMDPELLNRYFAILSDPYVQLVLGLISVFVNVVVIWGGYSMYRFRNRELGIIASILLMVPCCFYSCCWLLSLPLGIWSLIVLLNPVVKEHFLAAQLRT